jgi:uncharacterized LabA/DUF88 family protein
VDRCALFVDAGYVLTDGAMAARGANQREAVVWDYAGLLQFFAGMAADRTGLPMLRCYWYEATVDGRRTAEHDTLADLPGLALRLGRMRPGKREGVETEIHRDLTTLARNRAISDVVLVSAEDDLAQVIADVQDLGVRVTIVHISVDGNWTVSRALRQQCDDIVEIQGAQLRPYASPAGGEPARYSEQYAASVHGGRSMSNGHAATIVGGGHPAMPSGSIGNYPAPPAIYTAPVVAEYQQPQAPATPPVPPAPPRREPQPPEPTPAIDGDPPVRGAHEGGITGTGRPSPASASQPNQAIIGPPGQAQPPHIQGLHGPSQHGPSQHGQGQPGQGQLGQAQQSQPQPIQQLYSAPPAASAPAPSPASFREPSAPAQLPAVPDVPATQAQPGPPASAPQDQRAPGGHRSPYAGSTSTSSFMDPGSPFAPAPPGTPSQGLTPGHGPASSPPQAPAAPPQALTSSPAQSDQFGGASTSLPSRRIPPGHGSQGPPGQQGSPARPQRPGRGQQGQHQAPATTAGYVPQQAQYGAPVPAPSAPTPAPSAPTPAPSLAPLQPFQTSQTGSSGDDTVAAAHAEGFEFGESVARDAPALWLEAVLARKPRMPTDLEARLLQGSALPIDSLLRDEVRHALRRGFWDALERSRR